MAMDIDHGENSINVKPSFIGDFPFPRLITGGYLVFFSVSHLNN